MQSTCEFSLILLTENVHGEGQKGQSCVCTYLYMGTHTKGQQPCTALSLKPQCAKSHFKCNSYLLLFSQQSGYHGCRQSEKDRVLVEALEIKYIEQPDEATLIILLPRGSHPDYLKTIILLKSTTEHLSRDLTPCSA